MAITIDKWTLNRSPSWHTADGLVHLYSPPSTDGWLLRGMSSAANQALAQAGVRVGRGPHAATRGEAIAIAHSVTGCTTTLRQQGTQYTIVDHDYPVSDLCTLYLQRDDDGWKIWRGGLPKNADFDYHFDVFAQQRYQTRLAALKAFDRWMENCPSMDMPTGAFYESLPEDT